MLDAIQGRDTSVRDTMSKGGFVQGAQHPRILGRGHIGRGHINPASKSIARIIRRGRVIQGHIRSRDISYKGRKIPVTSFIIQGHIGGEKVKIAASGTVHCK